MASVSIVHMRTQVVEIERIQETASLVVLMAPRAQLPLQVINVDKDCVVVSKGAVKFATIMRSTHFYCNDSFVGLVIWPNYSCQVIDVH